MKSYTINYNNNIYNFTKESICTIKQNTDGTYTIALHNALTLTNVSLGSQILDDFFIKKAPALYMTSDAGNETPVYVDLANVCNYYNNSNPSEIYVGLKNSTIKYHYKYSEEFVTNVNDYWNAQQEVVSND